MDTQNFLDQMPAVREVVLHRMVECGQLQIPLEHFHYAKYEDVILEQYKCLMMRIQMDILSDSETVQPVKYPADWWQHFKLRWFPKWAKKKWPVRYNITEFCARHIYPQLTHHHGQQYRSVLKVMVQERKGVL